jgi:transaldolase
MPLDTFTLEALHEASSEGSRVALSMVFTSPQALLAARAGASAILVPVTALDAQGINVGATLTEMRAIFDKHLIEAEIIAVCPLSATQVSACALAGVDGVAIDISTLRDLLLHPLTDRTLDAMLPEILSRGRNRLPV